MLLVLLSTLIGHLWAQECPTNDATSPCCNGVISTDPRNGGTKNIERPSIIHKFNWMTPNDWNAYYPNLFNVSGNTYQVPNPFLVCEDEYLKHINLYNNCVLPKPVEKLDFHPEDGWELLHRQNGLDLDEVTKLPVSSTTRSFPYYILYNKYRGQLRLVGASEKTGNDAQKIVVSMGFPKRLDNVYTNVSALMSGNTNNAQTLDKPSQNKRISMVSDYPKFPGSFVTDFNVGYDPCACGRTPDNIEFTFSSLQSADIQMGGRLIGTNVPLNGSGTSPLLNRKDFLLQVNTDGFNVNGGATTYKNIDGLVEKYKEVQSSTFEKLALEGVKLGAKAGISYLSGGLSTGLRSLYCNYGYADLSGILQKVGLADANGDPKGFLKDGKLSAGTLAAGADFFAGLLFDKPQAIPNVTFLEAELALKGNMTTSAPFGTSTINLAHPGSKSAQANLDFKNYPFYNEALGVVSFLKQPKVNFIYDRMRETDDYAGTFQSEDFYIKLSEDFEYYFNPTLDIDLDKTKVVAAFVMDVDKTGVDDFSNEPFKYANKLGAFNRVIDSKEANTVQYITDFYPLECFKDLTASFMTGDERAFNGFTSPRNFKLKLFFDIKYKANKYGKENRQNFVYTFPLVTNKLEYYGNISEYQALVNNPKMSNFNFIELITDKTFTDNTEIRAWSNIVISGNIQVSPGKKVRLIAPQIDIAPGTNLPPNIEIISGQNPLQCAAPSRPVSATRMKQFCTSSEYKSNGIIGFMSHV